MAWPPTSADLSQARDELEERVAERPKARLLEPLARTHRWLDEREEASRRYREAAEDVQRVLERRGREDALRIAQVGSLLWRASAGEEAQPWFERALRAGAAPGVAAALHYLAEDFDRAAALAREASEDPDDRPYPWAEALEVLAIARREEDGDRATRARETFADLIIRGRTPPWEESGSPHLSLFDWFEEAALIEAWLVGQRRPDHAELLALLGASAGG
jgi:tetratricopeptide (TPR) repeat protein